MSPDSDHMGPSIKQTYQRSLRRVCEWENINGPTHRKEVLCSSLLLVRVFIRVIVYWDLGGIANAKSQNINRLLPYERMPSYGNNPRRCTTLCESRHTLSSKQPKPTKLKRDALSLLIKGHVFFANLWTNYEQVNNLFIKWSSGQKPTFFSYLV